MDIGDDSLPGWVFKMSLAGEHASRLVQEPEEHQGERHDPEDEELGPQGKAGVRSRARRRHGIRMSASLWR